MHFGLEEKGGGGEGVGRREDVGEVGCCFSADVGSLDDGNVDRMMEELLEMLFVEFCAVIACTVHYQAYVQRIYAWKRVQCIYLSC